MRDKASDLAQNFHTNLDNDQDGKISVKDLYANATEATQYATNYAYTAWNNSILSTLPNDILSSPTVEEYVMPYAAPYLDSIKTQWNQGQVVKDAFLPLWSAIEVVKTY